MKITEVRVIVTCPGRNYVLIKVMTDEPGLYGVGDATLNGRELAVATALEEHIAPLLIGLDPDRIEDTWQYLFRGTYWRGGPGRMSPGWRPARRGRTRRSGSRRRTCAPSPASSLTCARRSARKSSCSTTRTSG